ncbi:STAS/SEC14 domain-containing protein [Flavobacterium sp. MMLR14_040]|uniref:STAS/SEC14 domain-containing protein n=1 Tax=Flavobacterium sp. MMLR14_040 TaxID=3093843 RepID=UPI0029906698|nr:STAS/SEC14 domain-containing protein [Flavobacterium sp. MMLR14_040]MDW8852218.1 STAS/SEC14 domain-containing protein [Flavobacterium sp. MMLR14_040]
MIQILDAPENVVAFRALGEVTKDDYQSIMAPAVEKLVERINEINFLFLIDTDLENFTAAAWMQDAMIGLKNLGKWNRAAIVTDSERAITFTNGFSYVVPGEFRGYKKESYQEAMNWVQGNDKQ